MRSFNKGGQPGRVLSLAEITREKKFLSVIPYFLKWYLPVAYYKIGGQLLI
ncbi:hypothetical protein AAZX31_19G125400 [Glycine max]